jgi:hypothetical protein
MVVYPPAGVVAHVAAVPTQTGAHVMSSVSTSGPQLITPGTTVRNAEQLAQMVFQGYNPHGLQAHTPILIAQVKNLSNTYLVTLSGTELTQFSQATGIPEDLAAAFDLPDDYSQDVMDAIKATVPAGATLILAGHSLGGMEAQNMVPALQAQGYRVSNVITFGSPVTAPEVAGVTYTRFMTNGDLVPDLSPEGAIYALEGHPEQIHIKDGIKTPDFPGVSFKNHSAYPHAAQLALYDALGGIGIGSGTVLKLGPVYHFAAPGSLAPILSLV